MKIARLTPLTYTPGKLETFSFIRGGAGADYHQNPGFHAFPDGAMLMHWWAYDFDECSNNSVQLYSISRDRGLTWSDPQVYMADFPGGIPYLKHLALRDGQALLFVTQTAMDAIEVDEARRVATRGSNYFASRSRLVVRHSADGGRSFDHGVELPDRLVLGDSAPVGAPFYGAVEDVLQLGSGRIVAALVYMDYLRSDPARDQQHFTGVCLLSDDGGRTWRRGGELATDTPRGVMEPSLVEVAPNRLYCLMRTKAGCLYEARSTDGGETWDAPRPSPLTAPESLARMIRLRSGNLLLVWNNVASTSQCPRYPLVAALSRDGGRAWDPPVILAQETGTNQLSNHAVVQFDDGRILVALSHYRDTRPMVSDLDAAFFDETWLLRESGIAGR